MLQATNRGCAAGGRVIRRVMLPLICRAIAPAGVRGPLSRGCTGSTLAPISSVAAAPGTRDEQPRRRVCVYATEGDIDEAGDGVVELEVKIEGMKCGGCSSRVEEALSGMAGVAGVRVDLDAKLATVDVHAPSLLDAMNMLPQFVDAIKELGFEAEPHIEYQV